MVSQEQWRVMVLLRVLVYVYEMFTTMVTSLSHPTPMQGSTACLLLGSVVGHSVAHLMSPIRPLSH